MDSWMYECGIQVKVPGCRVISIQMVFNTMRLDETIEGERVQKISVPRTDTSVFRCQGNDKESAKETGG